MTEEMFMAFQLLQLLHYYVLHLQSHRIAEQVDDIEFMMNFTRMLFHSPHSDDNATQNDNWNDVMLFLSMTTPQSRRVWTEIRSLHWSRNVIKGILLDGGQFEDNFRMSRASFENLHALLGIILIHEIKINIIEPYITLQDTRFRLATPSRIRLLAFLYFITQGAGYRVVSNQFGMGISTVSKCVHDCTTQILRHMFHTYICLPTFDEAQQIMESWRHQTGIPGIVGAIDGTHIEIRKPAKDGEVYFNRKHFYSLNIQGILIHTSYIINI
jgi:hypothetical protein